MRKIILVIIVLFILIVISLVVFNKRSSESLRYSFSHPGILNEADSLNSGSSPYFWLNSGGELIIENGIGETMQDEALENNEWRKLYAKNNPEDTDNGLHPQNLFRLITKSKWKNFREQLYFNIQEVQLSSSKNRNESNGLLLMMRYIDADNLYYAGIRVDGTAVIKKKKDGVYYTLSNPVYLKDKVYDPKNNPNLLPLNKWIGVRSNIVNLENGQVEITLYVDENGAGNWREVARGVDDGKSYGGEVIGEKGYAGVRTDFMDVYFKEYYLEEFK